MASSLLDVVDVAVPVADIRRAIFSAASLVVAAICPVADRVIVDEDFLGCHSNSIGIVLFYSQPGNVPGSIPSCNSATRISLCSRSSRWSLSSVASCFFCNFPYASCHFATLSALSISCSAFRCPRSDQNVYKLNRNVNVAGMY
jgi:hypothetical protein